MVSTNHKENKTLCNCWQGKNSGASFHVCNDRNGHNRGVDDHVCHVDSNHPDMGDHHYHNDTFHFLANHRMRDIYHQQSTCLMDYTDLHSIPHYRIHINFHLLK